MTAFEFVDGLAYRFHDGSKILVSAARVRSNLILAPAGKIFMLINLLGLHSTGSRGEYKNVSERPERR